VFFDGYFRDKFLELSTWVFHSKISLIHVLSLIYKFKPPPGAKTNSHILLIFICFFKKMVGDPPPPWSVIPPPLVGDPPPPLVGDPPLQMNKCDFYTQHVFFDNMNLFYIMKRGGIIDFNGLI
jgi:hypothetical protein